MKVELGRLNNYKANELAEYIRLQYESYNPLNEESCWKELFEKLAFYINIEGIVAAGVKPEDLIIQDDYGRGFIIYYVTEDPEYEKIEEIKRLAAVKE